MRMLVHGAIALGLVLLLQSCASAPPDQRPVPREIELRDEPSISTFHFPAGIYSLGESDNNGFYFTAPRPLVKHGFPGSIPYEGGIFMPRQDHRRLRGYVIWAGGRTPFGDLSGANCEFRD